MDQLKPAMKYSVIAAIIAGLLLSSLADVTMYVFWDWGAQQIASHMEIKCNYDVTKIEPPTNQQGYGPAEDAGPPLHLLELCAGKHRITDAAVEYGLSALPMDVFRLHLNHL